MIGTEGQKEERGRGLMMRWNEMKREYKIGKGKGIKHWQVIALLLALYDCRRDISFFIKDSA